MRLLLRASFASAGLCLLSVLTGCSGSSPSSSPSAPVTTPTPAVALSITSVAPTKVPAGSANFQLTVNGTGFQADTALKVGGAAVTSTFVSTTQLTASVPAKSVSNGALLPVVAANGTTTSASDTGAVKLEVDNPLPQISSFAPLSLIAGSGSTTLLVTGSGFVPSTVIEVNGSSRPTAFVSGTQVNLTVTDADLASGGALTLLAFNPAPAGGTSSAATVPIAYPAPGNITLSPSVIPSGVQTATTIAVTGTNFVSGSVAQVNGNARPTSVVSATQLTFALTVSDQAAVGTARVTVSNPKPGGGTSPVAVLTFATPTLSPSISTVSPQQFIVKTAATIYVSGKNLNSNAVVNWDGKPLSTTYVPPSTYGISYDYLMATVTADLTAATGTATITVTSPTAPAASNAVTVQIVNPPVPSVTAATPAAAALNTATTVTVTGAGFTASSVAQLDGQALATTFQDVGTLTAVVPASMVSLPGSHSLTVSTPAPGGGVSGALAFTSYLALPNTAMALNPVNGLLYVSVPSSAGSPYGNSVVSVDPATGIIGKPIAVGSEPGKLAISSDGTTAWVGLDAASAVRRIDLTTGTAGMQFSLGGNTGLYAFPPIVHAIAVLPGTKDSIVVSYMNNYYLYDDEVVIFDNGVPRTNHATASTITSIPAIAVNPSKPEVYFTSYESGYQVWSYDANGLTHLAGDNGDYSSSGLYGTALQVDGGRAYLDSGVVLDAESGTLQGTFYTDGTTVAKGPMVSDSALGKNFILLNTSSPYYGQAPAYVTLQAFRESDLTPVPSGSVQVGGAQAGQKYGAGDSSNTTLNGPNAIDTLVRWGSDGLAFRAANGIFSIRTSVVQDLSGSKADLQVTSSAPATAITGSSYTVTLSVQNSGPATASNVALATSVPTNVSLVSATPSQGACMAAGTVSCNLGNLASGDSRTITLRFTGIDVGDAVVVASVLASEADAATGNNSVSARTTLSGAAYALTPTLKAISPNAAHVGSQDLALTVTGSGFGANSTVNWAGSSLPTTFVSSTQLTATVPATSLASLGWAPVSVSTPAPGGGSSSPLPFTVFNTVKLAANHLAFEPYSGRLYATVSSAATEVQGNTVVTVDPLTGNFGTAVPVGSQPSRMSFTDDGALMYITLTGATSVGRFDLTSQSLDFSFPVSVQGSYAYGSNTVDEVAVVPGTENTVAVHLNAGYAVYDIDPASRTASTRLNAYGQNTSYPVEGANLVFLDNTTAFTAESGSATGTIEHVTLSPTGLASDFNSSTEYSLNGFGTFQLHGGIGFADFGGVADLTVTPPAPKGVFLQPIPPSSNSYYSFYSTYGQLTAADTSLGRSFFLLPSQNPSGDGTTQIGLDAFGQNDYLLKDSLTLPYVTSQTSNLTNVDFVRWGQDGLAALLSDGQIIFVRGAFVVPALLNSNAAASLNSVSQPTLTHGSGNVVLTVNGSGFVPGVGVFWNGAYRTTTLVDAGHLTFNIPASDLAVAGTATITAVNPNAGASNGLTETIH